MVCELSPIQSVIVQPCLLSPECQGNINCLFGWPCTFRYHSVSVPQLSPVFLDGLSNMKLWLAQFCILFLYTIPPHGCLSVCAGCRLVWQFDDMHFLCVKRLVVEWEFLGMGQYNQVL